MLNEKSHQRPQLRNKRSLPASPLPDGITASSSTTSVPLLTSSTSPGFNDRTPPLHSLPPLPLTISNSNSASNNKDDDPVAQTMASDGAPAVAAADPHHVVPSSYCHLNASSSHLHSHHHRRRTNLLLASSSPPGCIRHQSSQLHDDGGGFISPSLASKNNNNNKFSSDSVSYYCHRLSPSQQQQKEQQQLSSSSSSNFLSSSSSPFNSTLSSSPSFRSLSSSSSSSSSSSERRRCGAQFYYQQRRQPVPLLSVALLAIFYIIVTFGPVSGQIYGEIRRQYWLMCPTSGGNATINVTCMGAPVYNVDLASSMGRVGDILESTTKPPVRGPIIRIVELRAHLISDQKAWSGFGPRSCLYTRELNKTTGEIAMASLGSLPLPVDPQDNVSDMLMKNCQAQTYCLSTDSKNINARQFSETFKAVSEAADVFHDQDKQMRVPVVLELGYLCTSNPTKTEAIPLEMCPSGQKNATKINIPVMEDGTTATTWLWSPNYQREDTPSQTSCECVLRSSTPSINVTLVAYHVRSWNSKTGGYRNVINKPVTTMYNDDCTKNAFEASNDPCIPALCRKTAPANGDGTMEYPATAYEMRLSSECLFSGSGIAPADREYYMRRVWFAIETTYNNNGEQQFHLRRRRRSRNSRRRRFIKRRRRQAEEEEVAEGGDEEPVDDGGNEDDGGADGEETVTEEPPGEEEGADGGDGQEETEEPVEPTTTPEPEAEPEEPEEQEETDPPPEAEPTEAPAAGGSDYEPDEPENTDQEQPPASNGNGRGQSPPGKPTVTITCYNFANPSPPTGQQRGGAASLSPFGSSLARTAWIVPAAKPIAFLLQPVINSAPLVLFAVLVGLLG